MGEVVAFFLALAFIGIGWGFWPFFWAVVGWRVMAAILRPKNKYETNWGNIGAKYGIIVLSAFAIHQKWDNPVITAIAIATAVILIVLG